MSRSRHRYGLEPGYELLWYRIERTLGQGGFGITYLAEDTKIHQLVAIKEYLPTELAFRDSDSSVKPVSDDREDTFRWGLERFLDEARTLARCQHRNIVRVLFYTEENDTGYVVMEYVPGTGLDDWLRTGRVAPEAELKALTLQLLDGLEAVHREGYIHRDIKPANIMLREDGNPVLLDFGAARQAISSHTRTLTAVVSPGYAPIEQYTAKGARQGPWTDLYALGATLYHLIGGKAPPDAIQRSIVLSGESDPMPPATEIGEGRFSPTFLEAIDRALAVSDVQRPQSVTDWRAMLNGEARSAPVVTSFDVDHEAPTVPVFSADAQAGLASRAPRIAAHRRWALLTGLVVLVSVISGMGVYLALKGTPPTEPAVRAPIAPTRSAAWSCADAPGRWGYGTGGTLEVLVNGTVAHRLDGTVDARGSWRCTDGNNSRLTISWEHGITDTLELDTQTGVWTGVNNLGLPVRAER